MSSWNRNFGLDQSENSILMTSYSLQMCSLTSTGAKTPYMFKCKCYMYYVFIVSLKLVSSNQKTVFWWRHKVLKICPSYSTGPQTPWLLATLTFSSVLNEYLFLAHFEFILAHCAAAPGSFKAPGQPGARPVTPTTGIWLRALNRNTSYLEIPHAWFRIPHERKWYEFRKENVTTYHSQLQL